MKRIVFDQPPKLSSKEKRIADMHSVLNILNVLAGELSLIEMLLDGKEAVRLMRLGDEIASIVRDIKESDDVSHTLSSLRKSEGTVTATVSGLLSGIVDTKILADIRSSLSNIESVYRIVHRRLDELESRAKNPDVWISISLQEFEQQFREIFSAIEKNSKGRYRILFNLARKSENDYYIDLKIESGFQTDMLRIPLRLVDVVRDLTANARKYTKPGGKVALAIYQSPQNIKVLVEDNGCGIPEDEIEHVVEFGYRASNVRDRRTMGGGYGLTKAAWLVNHWGGEFSIESAEGEGTIVRLTIPNKVVEEGADSPI